MPCPRGWSKPFCCLSNPAIRRFADAIAAAGVRVVTARRLDDVADLADAADIVQFEFWNHPRLYECLAEPPFPAMRSVFWSHISGLIQTNDSAKP